MAVLPSSMSAAVLHAPATCATSRSRFRCRVRTRCWSGSPPTASAARTSTSSRRGSWGRSWSTGRTSRGTRPAGWWCARRRGAGRGWGTRVAIEPGIPCRRCALCKSGRYNLCRDVVFMSAPPVNGTFAEYAAVAADFAHPLPDAVDEESGAFVEPLAVGRAGLRPGRPPGGADGGGHRGRPHRTGDHAGGAGLRRRPGLPGGPGGGPPGAGQAAGRGGDDRRDRRHRGPPRRADRRPGGGPRLRRQRQLAGLRLGAGAGRPRRLGHRHRLAGEGGVRLSRSSW